MSKKKGRQRCCIRVNDFWCAQNERCQPPHLKVYFEKSLCGEWNPVKSMGPLAWLSLFPCVFLDKDPIACLSLYPLGYFKFETKKYTSEETNWNKFSWKALYRPEKCSFCIFSVESLGLGNQKGKWSNPGSSIVKVFFWGF